MPRALSPFGVEIIKLLKSSEYINSFEMIKYSNQDHFLRRHGFSRSHLNVRFGAAASSVYVKNTPIKN
jgi:hypothetical protein